MKYANAGRLKGVLVSGTEIYQNNFLESSKMKTQSRKTVNAFPFRIIITISDKSATDRWK